MTNKEAIEILTINITELLENPCVILDDKLVEANKVAIKALEERPTGEWIPSETDDFMWKCSNCNKDSGYLGLRYMKPKYAYCPNCGAKLGE